MERSLKYKDKNELKRAQRELYNVAYARPIQMTVEKQIVKSKKSRKDDKTLTQLEPILLGNTEVLADDLHGHRIRRNLSLSNGQEVILQ